MFGTFEVRARTALSPEWDRGFDEAFAELVSSDPDLVQAEFDDLIASSWDDPADAPEPPEPPPPEAGPASAPEGRTPGPAAARAGGKTTGNATNNLPPPP